MQTILEVFQKNVSALGGKTCFQYKKDGVWQNLSWLSTGFAVNGYAQKLIEMGVKAGDMVGILSSTRVEWTIADMAILSIGAVTVPIYPTLTSEQINYILNDAGVKALFVENKELLEKAGFGKEAVIIFEEGFKVSCAAAGGAFQSSSLVTIIYTSGTTGEPKGVQLSHENLMAEVNALKDVISLSSDEVMLSFLPLAHVLARAVQFYQLAEGCIAAYAESIDKLPQNFIEVRPHMSVVVPRVIEKMHEKIIAKLPYKLLQWVLKPFLSSKIRSSLGGRLKFFVSGGAPLSPEIAKFFADVGVTILEGYGLTETFAAVTVNRPEDIHIGTVGKPISGVSIKISGDNEILVKGGMVFKEYFKKPEDTSQAFTEDGWFKTGDIGKFSKDGSLIITGRKKELIITSGGKNVSPQRVENLLKESRFISNAFVHGDKRKFITALLTLNTEEALKCGVSLERLTASIVSEVNKKLAQFEAVKKFTILERDFTIDSGELTPTMKLKRRVIEEKYKDVLDKMYKD